MTVIEDDPAVPNTPGALGYVGGILLGLGVLAAPFLVLLFIVPEFGFVGLIFVVGLGVPVAVVGASLLHLLLRHQPRQEAHVLGAAFFGAAGVVALGVALGIDWSIVTLVALVAGMASAFGRAMVSPYR